MVVTKVDGSGLSCKDGGGVWDEQRKMWCRNGGQVAAAHRTFEALAMEKGVTCAGIVTCYFEHDQIVIFS